MRCAARHATGGGVSRRNEGPKQSERAANASLAIGAPFVVWRLSRGWVSVIARFDAHLAQPCAHFRIVLIEQSEIARFGVDLLLGFLVKRLAFDRRPPTTSDAIGKALASEQVADRGFFVVGRRG